MFPNSCVVLLALLVQFLFILPTGSSDGVLGSVSVVDIGLIIMSILRVHVSDQLARVTKKLSSCLRLDITPETTTRIGQPNKEKPRTILAVVCNIKTLKYQF